MNTTTFLDEKIGHAQAVMDSARAEIARLEEQKKKKATGIESWIGFEFESSSGLTEEFATFAREYRAWIKKNLPAGAELVGYNRGHFYLSGFIKRGDKFVYFSTDDVRWSGGWAKCILIRTAKHEKDYTGGSNNQASLENFKLKAEELLNQ